MNTDRLFEAGEPTGVQNTTWLDGRLCRAVWSVLKGGMEIDAELCWQGEWVGSTGFPHDGELAYRRRCGSELESWWKRKAEDRAATPRQDSNE
jgi:hypothetical protein